MKKVYLAALLCFCLSAAHAGETNPWAALNAEAKRHLVNLINIDTSLPEPDELSAARYLYKEFNKHQIDWDIFIPSKGRAN
ncbi:MAG: hypothetical protein Q4P84_03015, partial [Elusimicrobiales bacterium]|nr:hypothetical protein [Elusimicrobiales bacterium]